MLVWVQPRATFFIAYAQRWCGAMQPEYARESLRDDSHGLLRFRVNGPLANLPAFSCPKAAAMAPPAATRCAVW